MVMTRAQKAAQHALEELLATIGDLHKEHSDEAKTSLEVSIYVDRKSLNKVFAAYRKLMS